MGFLWKFCEILKSLNVFCLQMGWFPSASQQCCAKGNMQKIVVVSIRAWFSSSRLTLTSAINFLPTHMFESKYVLATVGTLTLLSWMNQLAWLIGHICGHF